MRKEDLYNLLEDNNSLNNFTQERLHELLSEYPYFETARLLYTQNLQLTDSDRYADELGKSAVLCADRKKLFYLLYPEKFHEFFEVSSEDIDEENRTDEIINSYFNSFEVSENDSSIDETGLSIVSTDYFTYLEKLGTESTVEETNVKPFQHQDIIDAFIEKNENESFHRQPFHNIGGSSKKPVTAEREEKDEDNDSNEFLTETLANIYIKQKKYEQALTIIKRLSLNFPKKSAYFADQIRFLEFLIINDKK